MAIKKLYAVAPQPTEEYKKAVLSLDEECVPEHYRAMAELLPEDEEQKERNKKYCAYSRVHFSSD